MTLAHAALWGLTALGAASGVGSLASTANRSRAEKLARRLQRAQAAGHLARLEGQVTATRMEAQLGSTLTTLQTPQNMSMSVEQARLQARDILGDSLPQLATVAVRSAPSSAEVAALAQAFGGV